MIKLSIDDYLLVKQTDSPIESPWGYRIRHIDSSTTIANVTGITATYVKVPLTSATYSSYVGKTLLLELFDNSNVLIESDEFLLSGIYNKFPQAKLLAGLLGENIKKLAENDSDWQDGYNRATVVTTYTDTALTTVQQAYNYTQDFVDDYEPDHRYHTTKIKQKETS